MYDKAKFWDQAKRSLYSYLEDKKKCMLVAIPTALLNYRIGTMMTVSSNLIRFQCFFIVS